MSAETNLALVRRFFDEMCNARKLNVADEIYAANHAYHDPSVPTSPGPQGMKDVIGTYQTAYADAHWAIDDLFAADGDRVIARWTGSGTQSGELMGIAPTRRAVKVAGVWVFRIAGGRIAESWNHWDCLGMLQQLGVVPSMNAAKK
jgi:steroid delta-isomerase-like uncharacterized protein